MNYEVYMHEAIMEAKKAMTINEVPIGAVIVYKNKIIGRGYNKRNTLKSPLAHAEIIAIDEASKYIGDWRLEDCEMYVTVEPCPMCAGAIVQSRIKKLIFGTENLKAGCAGTIINILQIDKLNHKVEIVEGILKEECSKLMTTFFKEIIRKKSS